MYKYLNPNLVVLVTQSRDPSKRKTLYLSLVLFCVFYLVTLLLWTNSKLHTEALVHTHACTSHAHIHFTCMHTRRYTFHYRWSVFIRSSWCPLDWWSYGSCDLHSASQTVLWTGTYDPVRELDYSEPHPLTVCRLHPSYIPLIVSLSECKVETTWAWCVRIVPKLREWE